MRSPFLQPAACSALCLHGFLKAASNQACGSRYAYLCGRRYHHQLGKTGRQPELTLGIICALIAAVCWGLEGMLSSYGGAMIDTDVATNIPSALSSGLVDLVIIVPLVGGLGLLGRHPCQLVFRLCGWQYPD